MTAPEHMSAAIEADAILIEIAKFEFIHLGFSIA
jgi:hypothetical protein